MKHDIKIIEAIRILMTEEREFHDFLRSLDRNASSIIEWLNPPTCFNVAVSLLGVPDEVNPDDTFDWQEGDIDEYERTHGPVLIYDGLYDSWANADLEVFVSQCDEYTEIFKKEMAAWKQRKNLLFV